MLDEPLAEFSVAWKADTQLSNGNFLQNRPEAQETKSVTHDTDLIMIHK